MDSKLFYIVIAVAFDGLAGLSGGLLPASFLHRHITSFLAFAAGTLMGAAFLELLPEALYSGTPPEYVMQASLLGFVIFYVVEHFLGSHASGQSGHKHDTIGPLILVGDALHNATDGIAIASAFLVDVKAGVITTLAVIVHELPQEIGDFAILVSHGYSRKKAMLSLFFVQLSALVGAFAALYLSEYSQLSASYLTALSAGGFIYIASADLLPELQRQKTENKPIFKLLSFALGVGLIALLGSFFHH